MKCGNWNSSKVDRATASARSWPSRRASALSSRLRRRRRVERGQILFDHLWGIPGGAHGRDLALLRTLGGRDGQADGGALAAPYVLLDQRDIAENRDNCCNHSFGRAAREYAWHTALHGLKHTVFDRDRLPARVCWGALVGNSIAFLRRPMYRRNVHLNVC